MIGPVGYWKKLQQYQFNVLKANGLKPEHALLDLGCGPLQGGIAFIRYLDVSRYTGVDIIPANVDAACQQIVLHRLGTKNPRIIHSGHFGEETLGEASFDFIFASQILYILDEKTVSEMLAVVGRRLRPGGKFLGDIVNPEKHATVSALYAAYFPHSMELIQRLAGAHGLQVRSLGEILQYHYPAKLTLRQSLMLEFTKIS